MRVSLGGMRSQTSRVFGDNISIVLMAVLFSLAQWHLVEQVLGIGYADSIREAKSVFLGTPTWRVYQGRVLGPYLVEALSRLLTDYERAYWLFSAFCLAAAGYLSYYTGALINKRAGGLISFFLFQCLFSLLLDRHWLYVWDGIGIIIFYAFFIIVIRGASWRWTVLLFAVAIFNRESALFIALWLLVDPVCRWGLGRLGRGPARALDIYSMTAGAVCLALGILTIEALRTYLLIEEIGIRNGAPGIYGAHAFLTVQENINLTIRAWSLPGQHLSLIVPALLAVILYLIVRVAATRPAVFLGATLVCLAQIGAIMIFGLIYETRIFLEFIPFLSVTTALLMKSGPETVMRSRADEFTTATR